MYLNKVRRNKDLNGPLSLNLALYCIALYCILLLEVISLKGRNISGFLYST